MLKESLPPARKRQTSARYSPAAGTLALAIPWLRRRLSRVFRIDTELMAAQLPCLRKPRRERGEFMLAEHVEFGGGGDQIDGEAEALSMPLPCRRIDPKHGLADDLKLLRR